MQLSRSTALRFLSATALLVGAASPACGPGAGQSNGASSGHPLYEKSFAGANKCNPKNHNRPFIIDWDATDQSSFQAHTNSDIVFVEYKGCELRVLDGCRNDSVKGSFGSYKPVEFTSGGVETLDIHDEGELYAKLPLGAASLGGRVSSGEKFHMEYYVSGTRTATRDAIYRSDLKDNAACAGATHFVYAYNLGAFALASSSSLKSEVNGSYFGFGAGGSKASENKADKKGGELASCKGDSAKEIETCKVPVRLTLREITLADNPEVAETKAPETDASLALASKLKASTDAEKEAAEHFDTATTKMNAKDGKGCLAELDAHDKLDPRPAGLSINAAAGWSSHVRAQCLMLSGQCEAGKQLFRKAVAAKNGATMGAEQVDKITDATAGMWCQGSKLSPRDEFLRARMELQDGAWVNTKDAAVCLKDYKSMWSLRASVKPKDDDDAFVKDPEGFLVIAAPSCLAKAGDCAQAWTVYKEVYLEKYKDQDWVKKQKDDTMVKKNFESSIKKCKGK